MDYNTYKPHPALELLINFYWTLEIPADKNAQKQQIIPDGNIEMTFILGDDIMRCISEDEFVKQPRAMILGQVNNAFYVQPTGYVNTFAISFYPYGFANFITEPIKNLINKETPLAELFGYESANVLEQKIISATNVKERIKCIEDFLFTKLNEQKTIDHIVKSTVDTLLSSKGSAQINSLSEEDLSKKRKLERMFQKQIGISPKQLSKLIRFQSALKAMLNEEDISLTNIAHDSNYYDQSHFIKDFKEFTGVSPKDFVGNENMALSSLFYK